MIRKIIQIDDEKCNGCGRCATACHEGAIGIISGKARLLREDYCDGLGDCLPACPTDAISFELREAPAYDEAAVLASRRETAVCKEPVAVPAEQAASRTAEQAASGTAEQAASGMAEQAASATAEQAASRTAEQAASATAEQAAWVPAGQLGNFPVQIKLLPSFSPVFEDADLLIAADCTAYAYGNFHERFIKGRTTLIGCPKLDREDYSRKLTEIFKNNAIRSVTLVRMQVPCCGGLTNAVRAALAASGKEIPFEMFIVTPQGNILGE